MKVRCRFTIFAISLIVCVIMPPKAFASYDGAAYKLFVSQDYIAWANVHILDAFYTDSFASAYNAYLETGNARTWGTNAYNELLAQYLIDGNLSGYYAQYYAFYAQTYAWYAETYLYYVSIGIDYTADAIAYVYLTSYFAALAAYYAGGAS